MKGRQEISFLFVLVILVGAIWSITCYKIGRNDAIDEPRYACEEMIARSTEGVTGSNPWGHSYQDTAFLLVPRAYWNIYQEVKRK